MHHFHNALALPVGIFGSLFTVFDFVAFMGANDLDLHVQFVAWSNFELGDIIGPLLGTGCEDDVGLTKVLETGCAGCEDSEPIALEDARTVDVAALLGFGALFTYKRACYELNHANSIYFVFHQTYYELNHTNSLALLLPVLLMAFVPCC